MGWVRTVARRIAPQALTDARARRRERAAIALSRPFMEHVNAWCGGVHGKRLLEVGSDQYGRLLRSAARAGAAEALGVNPAVEPLDIGPGVRLLQHDAADLPFDDGHFDAAFSDSVFEHVHDLPAVLAELHRVVRPGGTVVATFGPIWSTPYGHHLWAWHDGELLSYHNVVLPSWCHLIDTPEDVGRFARERGLSAAASDKVVRWVFEDDGQNRLLFDDYLDLLDASPWRVAWAKGYDDPRMALLYRSRPGIGDRLAEVERRHPSRQGWLFDGIEVVLERD